VEEWLRNECRVRWERVEVLHDELESLPPWRVRTRARVETELEEATREAEHAAKLLADLARPPGVR
jgi:hypothetical protein